MKISGVILTHNEERNIKECIESLRFCNEIIVIDDFSNDLTVNIARSMGVKVLQRRLNNNFAKQRNFALKSVKYNWVLFIDADERVSSELASEIIKAANTSDSVGFIFRRLDNIWGRNLRYGESANARLLRMAKRNAGLWKRAVHEKWDIRGRISMLQNPIIHFPHQTMFEFLKSINYYSGLHAKVKMEEGIGSNVFKVVIYPKIKFIKGYVMNLGFLDGIAGLVFALMMSFHSFLAWSKLLLLNKQKL